MTINEIDFGKKKMKRNLQVQFISLANSTIHLKKK